MDDELVRWMILGSIVVAGLAVCVASWFPREKRLQDWLMVGGSTLVPLSLIVMIVLSEYSSAFRTWMDWLEIAIPAGIAGGSILFAMGFVLDRVSRRRHQNYREVEVSLPPA